MRAKKKAPGKGFSLRASLVLALGLVLAALLAVMGYYIFGVRDTARRQAEESFQNLTEASRAQLSGFWRPPRRPPRPPPIRRRPSGSSFRKFRGTSSTPNRSQPM